MVQRILVLAPHTDDGELGCGGTIARFVAEGHQVRYVAFSAAEKSVKQEYPSDVLRREVIEATGVLGVPRENLQVLDFTVRDFPAQRQQILEVMVRLYNDARPNMVFLPSSHDTHQDHQTISAEGFRAFKRCTILGYELLWNCLAFTSQMFVVLEEAHVQRKLDALTKYHSQADRPYVQGDYLRHLAHVRGGQIGAPYAEAFQVFRWIMP